MISMPWYLFIILVVASFCIGSYFVIFRYQTEYKKKATNAVQLGNRYEQLLSDHLLMQKQISSALLLLADGLDIETPEDKSLLIRLNTVVNAAKIRCTCVEPVHFPGEGPCTLTFFDI